MFKRYRFVALMVFSYVFSCGIAGTACADDLTVYAKQVILNGSINMAFYVALDENDLKDETTKTTSFTINDTVAKCTFNKNVSIKGNITDGKFTEADNGNTTLYAFVVELTSVQMNDKINGTITVGSDGNTKTGTVTDYTVQEYLNTLTTGSYGNNTKNLANALKDYGHYAQITLDEAHDEWKLGTDHTVIDANNNSIGTTTTDNLTTYTFTNNTGSSVYYTLDLDSKITLNVYFPKDMAGASGATSTVAKMGEDANGKKTEYEGAKATGVTPVADGEYYALSFGDISAHEFDNKYEITVNGKTIEIYPLSYVKTILDESTTYRQAGVDSQEQFTNLKKAIVALYEYYKATVAYREKPND